MGGMLSTFPSNPDQDGNTYRVYMEPKSKQYTHVTVHEGKCFGTSSRAYDPRHEQSVICKLQTGQPAEDSKAWALDQAQTAQEVRKFAQTFNNNMKGMDKKARVRVLLPQYANLDKVPKTVKGRKVGEFTLFEEKLNNFKCFVDARGTACHDLSGRNNSRSHTRRVSVEEAEPAHQLDVRAGVLPLITNHILDNSPCAPPVCDDLEQSLPPSYEQSQMEYGYLPPGYSPFPAQYPRPSCPSSDFINANIPVPSTTAIGNHSDGNSNDQETAPHAVLQAFIHHFFTHTGGRSIIANLKGACTEHECYTLSMPTIHSIDRSYGHRDQGASGIASVISNHTCSSLCRHLPDMRSIFSGRC